MSIPAITRALGRRGWLSAVLVVGCPDGSQDAGKEPAKAGPVAPAPAAKPAVEPPIPAASPDVGTKPDLGTSGCPTAPGVPVGPTHPADPDPTAAHCPALSLEAGLREAELEACARRIVGDHSRGRNGQELEWSLALATKHLPGLRAYRASDRYPRTLFIDLVDGTRVEGFDLPFINHRLQQRSAVIESKARARALASFIVGALNEPYAAQKRSAKATATPEGISVAVTFERTTVWAPPSNPLGAGAKVAEYVTTLRFGPDGCVEDLGTQEVRVIETRG